MTQPLPPNDAQSNAHAQTNGAAPDGVGSAFEAWLAQALRDGSALDEGTAAFGSTPTDLLAEAARVDACLHRWSASLHDANELDALERDALERDASVLAPADGRLDELPLPAAAARLLAGDLLAVRAEGTSQALPPSLESLLLELFDLEAVARTPTSSGLPTDASAGVGIEELAPGLAARSADSRTGSLSTPTDRRAPRWRAFAQPAVLMRMAAAFLVAVGAALWVGLQVGHRAEAALPVTRFVHWDPVASVRRLPQVEAGRWLAAGETLAAHPQGLLAVAFTEDALLVIGDEPGLDVVSVDDARFAVPPPAAEAGQAGLASAASATDIAFRASDFRALHALLPGGQRPIGDFALWPRLASGEARLATTERALPLQIGRVGLFVLVEGAAHVLADAAVAVGPGRRAHAGTGGEGMGREETPHAQAVVATDGWARPVLSLAPNSSALFWRPGSAPIVLASGERTLLEPDGPRPFGQAAASLFRELRLLGGDVPVFPVQRRVPVTALHWLAGPATRRGQALEVPACARARWQWQVPAGLARADRLAFEIAAPAGTRATVSTLGIVAEFEANGAEPGVCCVEVPLAAGWLERLAGRTLEFEVAAMPAPKQDKDKAKDKDKDQAKDKEAHDEVDAHEVPGEARVGAPIRLLGLVFHTDAPQSVDLALAGPASEQAAGRAGPP